MEAFLFFLFVFLSFLLAAADPLSCYYPNGDIAPNDTPCDPTANATNATFCCGQGYACLSNMICMSTPAVTGWNGAALYSRGSCTDQTWEGSCPWFCVQNSDSNSEDMIKCPSTTQDSYCCSSISLCDCESGDSTIDFDSQDVVETTIGVVSSTSTTLYPSSSSSSSDSPSSNAAASDTGIAVTYPSQGPSPSKTFATSATPTSSPNTNTSTPVPSNFDSDSDSESRTVAITLGLSIPIGLFAIAGLACAVYRHCYQRQTKKRLAAAYETQHQLDSDIAMYPDPKIFPEYESSDKSDNHGSGVDKVNKPFVHEMGTGKGAEIYEMQ
ncbi:hypothetical protein EG329_005528 [Mollisiaceae sp. DMI_Dod_QoI]|nr:hypothetical protein EG329_005528 [Helotiales sp. DMI_Dod_QoI]